MLVLVNGRSLKEDQFNMGLEKDIHTVKGLTQDVWIHIPVPCINEFPVPGMLCNDNDTKNLRARGCSSGKDLDNFLFSDTGSNITRVQREKAYRSSEIERFWVDDFQKK